MIFQADHQRMIPKENFPERNIDPVHLQPTFFCLPSIEIFWRRNFFFPSEDRTNRNQVVGEKKTAMSADPVQNRMITTSFHAISNDDFSHDLSRLAA